MPGCFCLQVRTESNKEASTNNANLVSVYGGYAGANYSSPYSSRHQHPNATSPGFPLSSSPYASPKAVQGGVIGRNESHTSTSALPATRLTKAHSIPSASPKGAYAHGHIASTGGMAPSPGHGSMASQGVPGFAQPTFSANVVMNRRNSLSSTAPPGSLASISKLAESAAGGGVAALLGGAGSHTAGSFTIHTATARLTTPLGSTLPPSSSRPGTATLHIGARPSTATNGSVSATTRNAQTPALPGLSLSVGSAQSMGCRGYQEDYRHIVDASATPVLTPGFQNILLGAAVYDGHGGKRVAQWLSSQYLLLNKAMEALQGHIAAGNSPERAEHVLNEVFCACGSQAVAARMNAGSCASIAVVCHLGGIPWVVGANVGDSRTVVVGWEDEGVGRLEVVAISIDHKLGPPKLSEETRRVQVRSCPWGCK